MGRQTHSCGTHQTGHEDLIELEPHTGASRCAAPAVEIHALTAPGLESANRVFVWSIECTRDPRRHYRVHLVRDVPGFPPDRLGGPRSHLGLALPQLGARGRVLVNRVDQVYWSDPAELFDMDLGGCALLTPSKYDADVIVMNADRCANLWSLEQARRSTVPELLALAARQPDTLGQLPVKFCQREQDPPVPQGGLVRFATPQHQPWRPFPQRFVYRDGPGAERWRQLDASAQAAGFQLFDERHPSRAYLRWRDAEAHPTAAERAPLHTVRDRALREALARAGVEHVSLVVPGARGEQWRAGRRDLERVWRTRIDPIADPLVDGWTTGSASEGVIFPEGLDTIPAADRTWVLDALGSRARRFVYVAWSSRDRTTARDLEREIEAAARRHSHLSWLAAGFQRGARMTLSTAGRRLDDERPRVWVLTDNRAGNTSQALGLAARLEWPITVKQLSCGPLSLLQNRILGASRAGVRRARSAPLEPPWPDLVLAAGRRTAPVALWIQKQNLGMTRVVQLGRKGGDAADAFDLVCTPRYGQLFEHPRRVITSTPLHSMTPARLAKAAERWRPRFEERGIPRPWISVLLGGSSSQYRMTPGVARALGRDVVGMAREQGGSVLATTSRRAGLAACEAFRSQLRKKDSLYHWEPNADPDANPYTGLLALADAIVVTADSESMLAEATAVGCPVYVYPLPERTSGPLAPLLVWPRLLLRSLRRFILHRATRERPDLKGGIAPPTRLDHLCARLIERGWSRPTRDLSRLHEDLFARGLAGPFGTAYTANPVGAGGEVEYTTRRVRELVQPVDNSG